MPFTLPTKAMWQESKHPRGQPENAGQFGSGGGSKKTPSSSLTQRIAAITSRMRGRLERTRQPNESTTYKVPSSVIEEFHELASGSKKEHQAIFDHDTGELLHRDTGTEFGEGEELSPSTSIPVKLLTGDRKLADVHTHPGGGGPSDADWGMMGWSAMKSMTMVGPDESYVIEHIGEGRRPSPRELRESWNEIEQRLEAADGLDDIPKLLHDVSEEMVKKFPQFRLTVRPKAKNEPNKSIAKAIGFGQFVLCGQPHRGILLPVSQRLSAREGLGKVRQSDRSTGLYCDGRDTNDCLSRSIEVTDAVGAGTATRESVHRPRRKAEPLTLAGSTPADSLEKGFFGAVANVARTAQGIARRYDESKHRRGQPQNRGQFATGGGSRGGGRRLTPSFRLPTTTHTESRAASPGAPAAPAAGKPLPMPGSGKPPPNLGKPKTAQEAVDHMVWLLGRAGTIRRMAREGHPLSEAHHRELKASIHMAARLRAGHFTLAAEAGTKKETPATKEPKAKKPAGPPKSLHEQIASHPGAQKFGLTLQVLGNMHPDAVASLAQSLGIDTKNTAKSLFRLPSVFFRPTLKA